VPISGYCRRCSLLPCPVPGAYLTTREAFHGHSQQPWPNSPSFNDRPIDLLTAPYMVNSSSFKNYIYVIQPPSEHASFLAMKQVHSRCLADDLPGPLLPLPLTLGLESQKLIALQVDAMRPGLVPRQPWSLSCLQCIHRSYHHVFKQLMRRIAYLSCPFGTVWQRKKDLASPDRDCQTTTYWWFSNGDTTHQLNLFAL